MRKKLLLAGLCTAAVLSFTACAGAESNGKEVETQRLRMLFGQWKKQLPRSRKRRQNLLHSVCI